MLPCLLYLRINSASVGVAGVIHFWMCNQVIAADHLFCCPHAPPPPCPVVFGNHILCLKYLSCSSQSVISLPVCSQLPEPGHLSCAAPVPAGLPEVGCGGSSVCLCAGLSCWLQKGPAHPGKTERSRIILHRAASALLLAAGHTGDGAASTPVS